MSDYMVRASAANGSIRAFALDSKEIVREAKKRHDLSLTCTAALGRLLSGAVMMGTMMKGDADVLTIQIKGDGPVDGLTVTADSKGRVKGYAHNPKAELPLNDKGKLDVGGIVGKGTLTVIKDLGLKDPYVGQIDLATGEIGDDLTYYFAVSEQVPSSVGLGVLVDPDGTVLNAGGFIVQLMPDATDEVIDKLEKNINNIKSVTALLRAGLTPEQMLEKVLEGFDISFYGELPVSFYCNCSKERVTKALISLGKKELESMANDKEDITLNCHFCNTDYTFTPDEIKEILECSTAM